MIDSLKSKLTRISKGDKPWRIFTAARVNGWLDVIEIILDSRHIKVGPGMFLNGNRFSVSGSSTSIDSSDDPAYFVYNASTGSTPRVLIKPGTHGGLTPTIDGNPMNVEIGSPAALPLLTLGTTDAVIYIQLDYSSANNLTGCSIHSATAAAWASLLAGVHVVPGTAGSDYRLISTVTVTVVDEIAKVQPWNDGVSGPQGYRQCGNSSDTWLV